MTAATPAHSRLVREYLAASGATAIAIVKRPRGYDFAVGRAYATQPDTVSLWLESRSAGKVARLARKNWAISCLGLGTLGARYAAEKELHRAAATLKVRLTPNNVVISRATFAAKRLSILFDGWNKSGALAEFNKEYKKRRVAATERGEKFMNFTTASARLRKLVIGMLISKQQIGALSSFFDEVFK